MLQLLPRSSTGERMNPYTSIWTGVHAGDGPRAFHLVLLDNGRTRALADDVGRDALRCIRCSACINVCPVYRQTGGHAYHTPYAGPIGAILQPQLDGRARRVRIAPVRIDALRRLRRRLPGAHRHPGPARARAGEDRRRVPARTGEGDVPAARTRLPLPPAYERAQRLARLLATAVRPRRLDPPVPAGPAAGLGPEPRAAGVPPQTFREWWESRDRA